MAGNDLIGMRDYLLALPRAFPSLPWFLHEEVVVQFFGASRRDRSILSMVGGSIVVGQQIKKENIRCRQPRTETKKNTQQCKSFLERSVPCPARARATRTIQNKFRLQNISIQV